MALWHMLDFGSGYNPALLESVKRTARETTEYGVLSMLLSSRPVDCHFMKTFSMIELQGFFCLDPSMEQELMPGIMLSRRGGPLLPFAQLLISTICETGRILDDLGHRTLGAFILADLSNQKASGWVLLCTTCNC